MIRFILSVVILVVILYFLLMPFAKIFLGAIDKEKKRIEKTFGEKKETKK